MHSYNPFALFLPSLRSGRDFALRATAVSALAQPAGAGSIEGRIFNPLTGELHPQRRSARPGHRTGWSCPRRRPLSAAECSPPANVTLSVSYTGYQPAHGNAWQWQADRWRPGISISKAPPPSENEKAIELDQIHGLVAHARGTAKAIMEQLQFDET